MEAMLRDLNEIMQRDKVDNLQDLIGIDNKIEI